MEVEDFSAKRNLGVGRLIVLPVAMFVALSLSIFFFFYFIDSFLAYFVFDYSQDNFITRYFLFDFEGISNALPSLAGLTVAVLGIVLTVVSIVLQLSSERYTGVAQMFLRDKINIVVMSYFVVASVFGVWVSLSLQKDFVPLITILLMELATTVSLVLMLPYFLYLFWFLEPSNIVKNISKDAIHSVKMQRQAQTLNAIEELSDIANHSIFGKDKIIASRCVNALKNFALEYIFMKPFMDKNWFKIGLEINENPDFVVMDQESLSDLEQRQTWTEWKVLRQYLGIFSEALSHMPDLNYLIAIETRHIGHAAARQKDEPLLQLVLRYMNSYLRASINAGSIRTAYNILNQYRLLLESFLKNELAEFALVGVNYMKYYGDISLANYPFVMETVAYDISSLCQYAHSIQSENEQQMLDQLLNLGELGRKNLKKEQQLSLLKAQIKLALFYLMQGNKENARRIAFSMKEEQPKTLSQVYEELKTATEKDFWEIVDRGRRFEYMPSEQRGYLEQFFSLFECRL